MTAPLHVDVVKLRHYICIGSGKLKVAFYSRVISGWSSVLLFIFSFFSPGLPLIVVGLWTILTYHLPPPGYPGPDTNVNSSVINLSNLSNFSTSTAPTTAAMGSWNESGTSDYMLEDDLIASNETLDSVQSCPFLEESHYRWVSSLKWQRWRIIHGGMSLSKCLLKVEKKEKFFKSRTE